MASLTPSQIVRRHLAKVARAAAAEGSAGAGGEKGVMAWRNVPLKERAVRVGELWEAVSEQAPEAFPSHTYFKREVLRQMRLREELSYCVVESRGKKQSFGVSLRPTRKVQGLLEELEEADAA